MTFTPELTMRGAVTLAILAMAGVSSGHEVVSKKDVVETIASLQIGKPLPAQFRCAKIDIGAIESTQQFRRIGTGPNGSDLYLAVTAECLRERCGSEGDLTISRIAVGSTRARDPAPICPLDASVRLLTGRGLKVGDPISKIEELFGKPARIYRSGGSRVVLHYEGVVRSAGFSAIGGSAPVDFVVTCEAERVLRIETSIIEDPHEPPI